MSEHTEPHPDGKQHVMFDLGIRPGEPGPGGRAYSAAALAKMAEQARKGVPIVDAHGVKVGETTGADLSSAGLAVRGTVDPRAVGGGPGAVQIIDDLRLDSVSAIPADQLVDPRCRFVRIEGHETPPAGAEKEGAMGEEAKAEAEKDPLERGYLSDDEMGAVESAVRRAKGLMNPETHGQLMRALWELGNLRDLATRLLGEASAAGLIEHAQVLRSRAMKQTP